MCSHRSPSIPSLTYDVATGYVLCRDTMKIRYILSSYPTLPNATLPYPTLCYLILCYPILCYPMLSYHTLSYPTSGIYSSLSCSSFSCPILLYDTLWRVLHHHVPAPLILLYRISWCPMLSCPLLSICTSSRPIVLSAFSYWSYDPFLDSTVSLLQRTWWITLSLILPTTWYDTISYHPISFSMTSYPILSYLIIILIYIVYKTSHFTDVPLVRMNLTPRQPLLLRHVGDVKHDGAVEVLIWHRADEKKIQTDCHSNDGGGESDACSLSL